MKLYGPAGVVAGVDSAVIFCEFGTEVSHAKISAAIAAKLKIHRSAFDFRRIDRLPIKDTGKIDYQRLLAQV